jgi:hypothetical protein
MFDRFARSWQLVKASAAVLRQDRELLVFPLVSTLAMLLVVATFVTPLVAFGWAEPTEQGGEPPPAVYALAFAFYLVQYFVIFFFNSALVGAALIRLEGGDPTVADGFRIAFSRIGSILGYALIAATVGLILRAIEERVGFVGKLVAGLLGAAWTVASFLAVPVLVSRDVGPIDAVKRSVELLKRSWGENIIGNAGIGLAFGLITFLVAFSGFGLALVLAAGTESSGTFVVVAGLTVVAVLLLALVQAALSGVYQAAVYRYAEHGNAGGAFDDRLLGAAFRPR